MAGLPATLPQTKLSARALETLVDHVHSGKHPSEIAKILYPDNKAAYIRTRRKIEAAMLTDPNFGRRLAARNHIEVMVGLGPTVRALMKRGSRGRTDAVKLILEASGFHNPRVQHEHSGEITVKLDMPRPKFVDATSTDEPVADAEVVD